MLDSTDSGQGTPAQLSDAQLTLALYSGSNRVSVYSGELWDSSTPDAVPPPILHDLTLDVAAFYAWKTYLKGRSIPNDHPAFLAYQNATQMLNDVRDGKIRLDPQAGGGVAGQDSSLIINRIPPVFTHEDSNTRIGASGVLEADTRPFGPGRDELWGTGGPVYQG